MSKMFFYELEAYLLSTKPSHQNFTSPQHWTTEETALRITFFVA